MTIIRWQNVPQPVEIDRKKKMLEPKLNPLTSNNDEGFKMELIIWGEMNDLDA